MNDAASRWESILTAIHSLGTELGASLSDGRVLGALGAAVLLGGFCGVFGIWLARRVGVLVAGAPFAETLAVGLGSGLLVFASLWAALFSLGRSVFIPVATAFALSIAWAVLDSKGSRSVLRSLSSSLRGTLRGGQSQIPAALAAVGFVVVVGLLYGATMAPSPRANEQPVEFHDAAYYSVLGADLARSATESVYSPSGFDELPNLPPQTWYHWGELWLSAAVITILGIDPIFARHYVVLPVVLLAAAALTGTLVRRLTGSTSRRALLFGAAACLFLAPLPLPGTFFSLWPTGLIFLVTMYGLATISALLGLYLLTVIGSRPHSWRLSIFSGAALATLLPNHVVIAVLAVVGVASVGVFHGALALIRKTRPPSMPAQWRAALMTTGLIAAVTLFWGAITGHAFGASGTSELVSPFDDVWQRSIVLTSLGAGVYLAIPAAWLLVYRQASLLWSISFGTTMLLLAGAVAWGVRAGDFNMFHVFYGGVAVVATPVAAVAVWKLWNTARVGGGRRIAAAIFVVCGAQLGLGVVTGTFRLLQFGPHAYRPIPVEILTAIEGLPADAKLAYSCGPLEEVAFWDARLLSIDAHTDRRIIPMCFQGDYLGWMTTRSGRSVEIESPLFRWAPQRSLYPHPQAQPASVSVASFMTRYGIEYIYADAAHPNHLMPGAVPIATRGDVQLLRVPRVDRAGDSE